MPATDGHRGHVIVCGLDHLGLRTIDELRRRDEDVVALGPSADAEEWLTEHGVRLVVGDPLILKILRDAGAEDANAVVMTGGNDLENLNIALAVGELNPKARLVIRMFDTELGAHVPDLFSDAVALSSSALAAPGFVSAAIDGESGGRFELAGRVLSSRTSADPRRGDRAVPLARLHADRTVEMLPDAAVDDPDLILVDIAMPGDDRNDEAAAAADASSSGIVGGAVAAFRDRLRAPEQRLLRFGTLLVLLAVASALYFEFTAGLTPLDAFSYAITLLTGASLPTEIDAATAPTSLRLYAIVLSLVGAAIVAIVYAFITDALIRSRLLQTLGRRTVPGNIHDHVIVAGLGAIGYRVALAVQERGVPVVVVESQEDGRFVSAARAAGIPVVIGDARHRELLDEARVSRARALVCATSDDLVNLSTALNGRALRSDLRVVVRLFDPDFALRVQHGFGIRFTRSVSQLAAPAFAAAAIRTEVVATVPIGDRRVALFARLRVPAGSALQGRLAASLDRAGTMRVLAVADPGSEVARWDVPPDEVLDADEEIVVAATRGGLGGLLHLAAIPAGTAPTIADLPPPGKPPAVLPFDPVAAVA
ncbi:MAG: NAD-binding protein, partial [Candidatus Limnocylindrales bacterium]